MLLNIKINILKSKTVTFSIITPNYKKNKKLSTNGNVRSFQKDFSINNQNEVFIYFYGWIINQRIYNINS